MLDPHYYFDENSKTPYLLWKTDENLINKPSAIYIRQLEPQGKSFTINSAAKKLLVSDKREVIISF